MPDPTSDAAVAGWTTSALAPIAGADDLYVAPERPLGGARGGRPGTPTWIWSVAVDDGLFVRAYTGPGSSWNRSALATGRGIVVSGGQEHEVRVTPA